MLDHRFVSAICDTYGLGLAMSRAEPVTGGLLHAMDSIRTTSGRYAVKVLDKSVVRTVDVRAEYRRSEAVAAKFGANGVPAVFAMDGRQGKLSDIGVRTAMVYPWVDGSMLPQDSAGPVAGRIIGSILGTMHGTDIPQDSFSRPSPMTSSFGEWRKLVEDAQAGGASWVSDVSTMVPDLMIWELDAFEATDQLGSSFVVSHRDLDQKNVLWPRRDAPAIVDWEGVGLVRPAVEVMCAALDWSGQKVGPPDKATFMALLTGYREQRPLSADECRLALKVLLGATGWLRANMRGAVDTDRSPDRRAQRAREIVKYAKSLQALGSSIDIWSLWCDEPRRPTSTSGRPSRRLRGGSTLDCPPQRP